MPCAPARNNVSIPSYRGAEVRGAQMLRASVSRTTLFIIAQRQMAVKDLNSNSWFSDCRRLLHKYGLPNIYTLDTQIESLEGWRAQLKRHIDSFIEKEWRQTDKSSLRFLNVKTLSVG